MRCGTSNRRDGQYLADGDVKFNASPVLGGQIRGEPTAVPHLRGGKLYRGGPRDAVLQTGETKYGKPIIDRVMTRSTSLADAAKCVLVSFDSTMCSNLSVGMPIDLICYEQNSLEVRMRRRFDDG